MWRRLRKTPVKCLTIQELTLSKSNCILNAVNWSKNIIIQETNIFWSKRTCCFIASVAHRHHASTPTTTDISSIRNFFWSVATSVSFVKNLIQFVPRQFLVLRTKKNLIIYKITNWIRNNQVAGFNFYAVPTKILLCYIKQEFKGHYSILKFI